MAESEVITKTDVANWTPLEDATEDVKKLTEQVKKNTGKVLSRKFKKFDAVSFRSGTPGGTGSIWHAVKVDTGDGDDRFIHVMFSTAVTPQKSEVHFERCALYYRKDAPVEIF